MSKNIDERVVEMKFDNSQFENGVKTSLSSIDKLKDSLNMDGAAKGLENVSSAASRCDMSGLRNAVETVHAKFSALEVMAVTALANITNSAVNAGKRILKSLTVEPVSQGFQEYELKMGSIQTIMASTGESLETVNKYLNELNLYADKTIYSFSDMTSNIGKFTNAGVKLEDAVKAIQGVSNEAAVSGANANEASRAMYNFAQALSAGYVKLIDWKSIENANMATVEFKNNLIQTALELGTLVEEEGMYQSTTTDNNNKLSALFDATHSFNESLSAQWMTTEVLVKTLGNYADETTEIGKKAFAAAQDVKTFTQLMDTLKEAAGSGWATTWETVFGDFEEAKKLWTNVSTVVGGFIDAQSDARNTLLQEWKDLGGRTKLIEALKNAFEGLKSVIKPITEAFREIFPKTTSKAIYSFTENFAKFTSNLRLSDRAADNLKKTFKGLFSILNIVKQAFVAVFNGIKPLFGAVDDLGGGILNVTGKIGGWVTRTDESIQKSGIFMKIIQNVVSFIRTVPGKIDSAFQSLTGSSIGEAFDFIRQKMTAFINKVKEFVQSGRLIKGIQNVISFIRSIPGKINAVFKSFTGSSIGEVFDQIRKKAGDFLSKMRDIFSGFGKIDTKGIELLSEKTATAFKPLTTLFDGIKKVFSGIWSFLKKLAPIFAAVATAIGKALGGVGSSILGMVQNADFDKILDLINSGVLIAIGVGIKKLIDSFKNISDNASGVLGSITGILDGVKGSLEAWQQDLKSNALLKIAAAIGILTLSMIVLSAINAAKLYDAIGAITVLFTELTAASAIMMNVGKTGKFSLSSSAGIISMAVGILILAGALKKVSDLDSDELMSGLLGIAGLAAILTVVAKQLSKNSKSFSTGAIGIIAFALAIRILVKPVSELSALDTDDLIKGLLGVGALCAGLALFLKIANLDKMGLLKGVGILALAEGIQILAKAVAKFSTLDTESLVKGLVGVGVVLLEIAAFVKLTGNSKGVISTAIGMSILGTAMLIFGKAISNIGALSWEAISKGLVGIGVALIGIAAAMKLMPNGVQMLAAGAGMILLGAAIKIFASAISGLGQMSWGELVKGLASLAIVLAEVVIAMKAINASALVGATGVLLCATALALLVPVLKILGGMSWESIAKGLLSVAGVFVIIGAAGYILKPAVGSILALSAAMTLIGVAAVAFGAGLLAISISLDAFAASAELIVDAIIKIIIRLVVAIPEILKELAVSLGDSVGAIVECIVIITKALLSAIDDIVPQAVEVVLHVVEEILKSLAAHIQQIIESLLDIIINVIEGLTAKIPQIITSAVKLFKAILDSIFEALGGFDVGKILAATAALTAFAGLMAVFATVAVEAVAATALLPVIGLNLNKFINNAEPFLEKIQNVDSASLKGAKYLAETVLMLTTAGIMDALTSWFTGGKSFIRFGEQLAEFAPYLDKYYKGIKNIDSGMVEASAVAAKSLAELSNHLPSSGGLVSLVTGSRSLTDFAMELTNFGPAMKSYAKSVSGIDTKVVANSAKAAQAMSELAANLPTHGGIKKVFTGDSTLSEFAEELTAFGPSMKKYARNVEGIDAQVVSNSAHAAMAISELAHNLPDHGGLKQVFTGDNTLSEFADELSKFGPAMKSYAKSVTGIDAGAIEASANAAGALVEVANALPKLGGLDDWLSGGQDFGKFGESLASFGESLKSYVGSVSGISVENVEGSVEATSAVIEIAKALPELGGLDDLLSGGKDFKKFGKSLAKFGESLSEYVSSVKDIRPDDVSGSTEATSALVNVANSLPELGGFVSFFSGEKSLKKFGKGLTSFGKSLVKYVETIGGFDSEKLDKMILSAQATSSMAKVLNEDVPEMGGFFSLFTGGKNFEEFGAQLANFGIGLRDYTEKVSEFDSDQLSRVKLSAQAASQMATVLCETPEIGGFFSLFTGGRNFETFGEQLSGFGVGLKNYVQNVNEFDSGTLSKVKMSAEATSAIAKVLNNDVPEMGGFVSLFTGGKDFEKFGEQLANFGKSLKSYSKSVSGESFNTEKVVASANAAHELANALGTVPNIGGFFSLFTGDQNFKKFGEGLVEFGKSLAGYSESVSGSGFNAQNVESSANAAGVLANVLNSLPNIGGFFSLFTGDQDFKKFGKGLSEFGSSLAGFSNAVSGIDSGRMDSALGATERLVALSRGIVDIDSDEIKKFGKSFKSLAEDGITTFVNAMDDPADQIGDAGRELINNFITAISNKILTVKETCNKMIDSFIDCVKQKEGRIQTSAKEFMKSFISGIESTSEAVISAIDGTIQAMLKTVNGAMSDFYKAGESLSDGFADGITKNGLIMNLAAQDMANTALSTVRSILGIHSPSKEFYEIGSYSVIGFTNALEDYSNLAYTSGSEIAKKAKDGLSKTIYAISQMLDDHLDCQPTIRPIVDLSDITKGVGEMNALFASGRSIDLVGSTGYGMNSYGMTKIQNGISVNQQDVVNAISDLRSDVQILADVISKSKMVLDTGELVGGLCGPMDAALGKIILRKERRN